MRALRIGSALAVLALAGSCGGGGGGGLSVPPKYGPASFEGIYRLIGLSGRSDAVLGRQVSALWGTATADGTAGVFVQMQSNFEGSLSTSGNVPHTYSVSSDGAIEIAGTRDFQGRLGEAGRLAVLGAVVSGDPAILVIAEVPTTTHTNAHLSGLYRLIQLEHEPTSGAMTATTGSLTADGGGGVTFGTRVTNREGAIGTVLAGAAASYAVAFDGKISFTVGARTLQGTVLAGGGLVLLGGGDAAGDGPAVMALVRAATGAASATFSGAYGVVSFEVDPAQGLVSTTGRLEARDSGVVRTGTSDVEGTIATSAPWSATSFVVTFDGGLVLFDVDGHELSGAVSDDGRYAILGGGTSAGSRPTFQVLVRQ